jgi:8-oxo-dGTP diphosphatase
MELLATLNANDFEPANYNPRPTAKAVIVNDKNELLLYSHFLVGGGVEEGETFEEALKRECMEEAGVKIEIIKPLGTVIQYRDELKKRYEVKGFLVKVIGEIGIPTTRQKDETGKETSWESFGDAISYLENFIKELDEDPDLDKSKNSYQGNSYNAKTHLIFIKKVQEILNK